MFHKSPADIELEIRHFASQLNLGSFVLGLKVVDGFKELD
jgi:hypothetical protein